VLELKNLTKIYKIKKTKLYALNNVNLTFGNKGLIFIVGKSGSGKSTLLNLLGGLDTPSNGKIFCDGIDIYSNNKELNTYRRNCIGFIFQDYCIIESMTVYDNIELGLSVNGIVNHDLIMETIDKVGLLGKENTSVNILSGGQKQRVAIARALLQNPKILLADEPTGNLDSRTSSQIFDILKEESKKRLVIVVSHNLNEAFRYGDRVIELSEGEVTSDLDRKSSETASKRIAFLPVETEITNEELQNVNDKLNQHNIMIGKNEMLFNKHEKDEQTGSFNYSKKSKPLRKKLKLFWFFIKKRLASISAQIVMISTLVFLIGLSQSYYALDADALFAQAVLEDDSNKVLRKGYYDDIQKTVKSDFLGKVEDEDIENFYKNGYTGEVYRLYKYSNPIAYVWDKLSHAKEDKGINFDQGLYLYSDGLGVLQCDEEYLANIYGSEGSLDVLAGDLYATKYGVTITDYFADSIISRTTTDYFNNSMGYLFTFNQEENYRRIVERKDPWFGRYKVNAIINTNYKVKYKYLFDKYTEIIKFPNKAQEILEEVKKSDLIYEFAEEIRDYLAISYSFNDNFVADNINAGSKGCQIIYVENGVVSINNNQEEKLFNQTIAVSTHDNYYNPIEEPVNEGEVYMSSYMYNRLFNTNLTYANQEGFEEREVHLNLYRATRSLKDEPHYTKKFVVKGLIKFESENVMIVSEKDYKDVRSSEIYTYGLYFEENHNAEKAFLVANSMNYTFSSTYLNAVKGIIDFSVMFKSIFMALMIGLTFTTVILLSSFASKLVKSYKRELGIIKAIGGKNRDFRTPFIIIVLIIGVLTAIISSIAILNITEVVNQIIVDTITNSYNIEQLRTLKLLQVSPQIIFYDLLILFVLILISILSPIMTIRKIKIVDILRRE
jgi:ABC-type lipoprotein export system ATPase subunit